eukprot:21996-Eustigmatos_ZCMA.PRE.1
MVEATKPTIGRSPVSRTRGPPDHVPAQTLDSNTVCMLSAQDKPQILEVFGCTSSGSACKQRLRVMRIRTCAGST